MPRFVSEIFEETPSQWGLRGDPFLWAELKEDYRSATLPYAAEALEAEILRKFEEAAGEPPAAGKFSRAPKYSTKHVGMSTGLLDVGFWLGKAIPLLTERLRQANESVLSQSE